MPKRIYRPLYIGEWIDATGRDIAGTAAAAGVNRSYISNMSGGARKNPSAHVLLLISEHLGITVNDLYHPPPTDAQIAALSGLSPAAREAVMRRPRARD